MKLNGEPWMPDSGDGTYKNPILYADYSDPDIVKVGSDFYMTASSFNCMPGLPILHSKDLVNWKIVNYACERLPLKVYDKPQHGKGIWAPSIKYHDGKVWIYVCTPDEGLFMTNTDNPMGKWSPLVHVKKVTGWIDPCPFWDDDGSAYILHAFANSRVGFCSVLHLCKMSSDGTQILDTGRFVVDVNGKHNVMEGPKLFKRNGYYYITAPAGGITHGYQVIMRSKNLYGPYDEKIAMHEGNNSINGPRQGGFVDLESGESWFVHFQDKDAYGRIVNLQPVTWKDDWMMIGVDEDNDGVGEPVECMKKPNVGKIYPAVAPQTSDDFNEDKLGFQWQWFANPGENWYSLSARKGYMRLYAKSFFDYEYTLFDAPNLLLQKFPAPAFEAEAKLSFSPDKCCDKTGIIVSGLTYWYTAISNENDSYKISFVKGFDEEGIRKEEELESCILDIKDSETMYIKVSVTDGAQCSFSYSRDGKNYTKIGKVFAAVAGRWIGSKMGIFCINTTGTGLSKGYADYDWFKVK